MKTVAIMLSLFVAATTIAWAEDWPMMQRDAGHSGSISAGPTAPLKQKWRVTSGDPKSSFAVWPTVVEGTVYSRVGPKTLAVNAETGIKLWEVSPPEGSTMVSPAVNDETIYVPVPAGRLIALRSVDGSELWRFQAEDRIESSTTLSGGNLFFGSARAKTFYAIRAADGTEAWHVKLDFEPDSVAAVSQGLVVFSMGTLDGPTEFLIALDASDGKEVWRVPQRENNSSPSILGDWVILGGGDLNVYALDLKTGKQIWKTPVPGKFNTQNFPAIAFGDVFMADRIGNIYRLDGKTGKRKWLFDDAEVGFVQSFPVIAGKTLFIGNGAGWLYALDTDNGRLLWKHQVGGFVLSGAADENNFYFGVKFRNEGLYAYEHDPNGKLAPPPEPEPTTFTALTTALAIFMLFFGAVVLITKRRRKASNLEA